MKINTRTKQREEWEETTIDDVVKNEFYDIDLFDIEEDVDYLVNEYISGTDEEIAELKNKLIERCNEEREYQRKEGLNYFADRYSILRWIENSMDTSGIYFLSSEEILEEIVKNYNKI